MSTWLEVLIAGMALLVVLASLAELSDWWRDKRHGRKLDRGIEDTYRRGQ